MAHNLTKRLEASNSLLRSAFQIAKREIEEGCGHTNWKAFKDRVEEELKIQHLIMYPKKKK